MGRQRASGAGWYITLTLRFHQEENTWVGVCQELGVSTFDEDLPTLRKELVEMTIDQLKAVGEAGELEEYLKTHGVTIHHEPVKSKRVTLNVDKVSPRGRPLSLQPGAPGTFASTIEVPVPSYV